MVVITSAFTMTTLGLMAAITWATGESTVTAEAMGTLR
jgi:hypothetical protein